METLCAISSILERGGGERGVAGSVSAEFFEGAVQVAFLKSGTLKKRGTESQYLVLNNLNDWLEKYLLLNFVEMLMGSYYIAQTQ